MTNKDEWLDFFAYAASACKAAAARSPALADQQAHEYPPAYVLGTHWASDAAWEILDQIKPGVIPGDVRAFLAGLIAARLMKG